MQEICRNKKKRAFKEVHMIAKTTLPFNIKVDGDMRTWIIDYVNWGYASLGLMQYLNQERNITQFASMDLEHCYCCIVSNLRFSLLIHVTQYLVNDDDYDNNDR